ncbi:MAG TPA: DUF2723 domain-containing protein [Longimicrobiales bacterium]|nr:DUF2723 domain-containing protein [Longimicrobiales bacterium]
MRLSERSSALALGVAAFLVYAATLYPSVAGGDSGELVAAVAAGGVPHPPGYPLYVLLTAPFTWLPVGNVAWRANLAAAVCAAAAAALLACAITRMTGRWWAGLAGGALFAFSPTVWLYATTAEVFALNNLLIAAQFCLFVAVDREPKRNLVYAGAFVLGLGISNHHTSVVFTSILLAGMLWRTRTSWRGVRPLATLAACGAAGLLPYLYLPLASLRHAPIEWGDTASVPGFITHFLRRDYGTFQLGTDQPEASLSLASQLGYYARDLVHQVSWFGVALAAWGLFHTLRHRTTRVIGVTTFAAWAAFLLVFHSLANLPLDQPLIHGVVARFWQAPNLFVCVWAGLGLASLTAIPGRVQVAAALGLAGGLALLHARGADHRNDYIIHDYGASVLGSAPAGALLLTRGDLITNTARYLNTTEKLRPDVRVLDMELLTTTWMTRQVARGMPDVIVPGTHYGVGDSKAYVVAQLVDANIARRPVLVCGGWKPGDASAETVYRRLPVGLCDRLVPAAQVVDVDAWAVENEAAMPVFRNDMHVIPASDSWEYVAWTDYWEARHHRAFTFLMLGIERQDDPALLRRAADAFDSLIASQPLPPASYYKNLGIARTRLAATDGASVPLAIAAFTYYLQHAPPDDADVAAIRQTVRELMQ